jgi:response regulator of citrate/malate metabolism
MQNTLIRVTFGSSWWEYKKAVLAEEKKLIAASNISNCDEQVDNNELQEIKEREELKRHMGILEYYIMPWRRKKFKTKIERMKKIEAELQKREEFGEEEL